VPQDDPLLPHQTPPRADDFRIRKRRLEGDPYGPPESPRPSLAERLPGKALINEFFLKFFYRKVVLPSEHVKRIMPGRVVRDPWIVPGKVSSRRWPALGISPIRDGRRASPAQVLPDIRLGLELL
jgi:hypothetical protein